MTTLVDGDPRLTRKLVKKSKPKQKGFVFTTTATYTSTLDFDNIFPDGLPKGKTEETVTVEDVVGQITEYMNEEEMSSIKEVVAAWGLVDDWDEDNSIEVVLDIKPVD